MGEALHYKHLAPLERKQLTVLHFEVESANDKCPMTNEKRFFEVQVVNA
jgi:hypothetical protein